jgi:hypothetical protein
VFSSYKSFYFVSKERMFVAGKQIKNNKIKRVLQMINFFFSYKSFCSVIVYEKKSHELYEIKKKKKKKP